MPLAFKPRVNPKVYLPGYKSLGLAAYSQQLAKAQSGNVDYGSFDQGQIAKIQNGSAELNANDLISMALKEPAYALETPVRPLDVATGGLVKGVADAVSNLPVIKQALGALGQGFQSADNLGAASINMKYADFLISTANQTDATPYNTSFGASLGAAAPAGAFWFNTRQQNQTVGQIRQKILDQFGTDLNGNTWDIATLTKLAKDDPWAFGKFATSTSPLGDMVLRMAGSPINFMFAPGAAPAVIGAASKAIDLIRAGSAAALNTEKGIELLNTFSKAYEWAKPVQKPIDFGYKYGYGYAKSLGRGTSAAWKEMHSPNPYMKEIGDATFFDQTNAAVAVANGGLQSQGYLGSVAKSMSMLFRGGKWVGQKVYLPGVNLDLKGGQLVGNVTRAYIRGGIQQQAVETAAQGLFGGAANYLADNNMNNNPVGGTITWLHDFLSKVNNSHPLSENDGYTMMALFLPAFGAFGDIAREPFKAAQASRYKYYVNDFARQLHESMKKKGSALKTVEDTITAFGEGDFNRGQQVINWLLDYVETKKVQNQLAHYTHQALNAEVDGLAERLVTQSETFAQNIVRRRQTGALQPKSSADYAWELHGRNFETPASAVSGEGSGAIAHSIPGTADSLLRETQGLYRAYAALAPQLRQFGLDLTRGSILTAERRDFIVKLLQEANPGQISPDMARKVVEMAPSLVWDGDFWSAFSASLGQPMPSGRRGKQLPAESVTTEEAAQALNELNVPSSTEMYHEAINGANKVVTAKKGIFQFKDGPFPAGKQLEAQRASAAGDTGLLAKQSEELRVMRDKEFTKSGKPRFGAAKSVSDPAGNIYERTADNTYQRGDGVAVSIKGGVVKTEIPVAYEADLFKQLRTHEFRSGPRKGQIKPGQEAEHAALNLAIEDARMGIDRPATIMATQHGARVIIAPEGAGPRLADLGYIESAKIKKPSVGGVASKDLTGNAAYSYRGGDTTKIIENSAAGAMPDYRPTKRIAKEKGAIGVAKRDARQAGLYVPARDYVGTEIKNAMYPEERRALLNEQAKAADNAYKDRLKEVSRLDSIAFDILPFDKKISEMSLSEMMDPMSPAETQRFTQFLQQIEAQSPELSPVSRGPTVIVDPAESRYNAFLLVQGRLQRRLIDYGWMSPVRFFYDSLFAPKHVAFLGNEAQTEAHNLLASAGWSGNSSRKLLAEIKQYILDHKAVEGWGKMIGAHKYSVVSSLDEGAVRAMAERIDPAHYQDVLKKWGNYQKMFTEASNRPLRTVAQRARVGGKGKDMVRLASEMMHVWQSAGELPNIGRLVTKQWYPWYRFALDPTFAMMNWFEPYIYGIANNGWRGLQKPSAQGERLAELASAHNIPPGGLYSRDAATGYFLADPGFYTVPQNIRDPLIREVEIKTQKQAEQMMEAMSKNNPVAVMLRERFGDNTKSWAEEANRMLTNLLTQPKDMLANEWAAVLQEGLGYSAAELKAFIPVAERLSEVYRGVYSDLVDLYVGRFSRSNLERFGNSFFVMWPVSYMIKVSKWMYEVLLKKIGPVDGAGGAYLWDQYRQKYENLVNTDPSFAKWTKDNADFLFALELLMPATPVSMGVSLNPITRRVGGLVAPDMFGHYSAQTLPEAAGAGVRFGPVRTANLLQNTVGSWLEQARVPLFYHQKPNNATLLPPR